MERLADELGLDAVGVAVAEPYEETERHIVERASLASCGMSVSG